MNERIKELRRQAIGHCLDKGSQGNLSEEVAEKFAELIVVECANRLAEDFISEDEIIEGYNDTWDSALRFGAQAIKQHFGVEE